MQRISGRDRNQTALAAALCTLFDLKSNEARLLALLLTADYRTLDELHAAAYSKHTRGSMKVYFSLLRKKLAVHDIWVTYYTGIGYTLRREARARICRRLDRYDQGVISTRKTTSRRRQAGSQQEETAPAEPT